MQDSDKNSQVIKYALSLTKTRIRLADFASSFLMLINATIILVLLGIVLDHSIVGGLSETARMIIRYSILAVILVMLVVMIIVPFLKKLNNLYVARTIEKVNPHIRNDLTTVLQIQNDTTIDEKSKQAILRVVGNEAKSVKLENAINYKYLHIASVFLCAILIGFILYASVCEKSVWDSFLRTVSGQDISAPTVVKIVKLTPKTDSKFEVGNKIQFVAEIEMYEKDFATLELVKTLPGKKPISLTKKMTLSARTESVYGNLYTAEFTPVSSSEKIMFRVLAGDAKTKFRELKVLPKLAIKNIFVTQNWPAYTGSAKVQKKQARIVAPARSKIHFSCTANHKVDSAKILIDPVNREILAKVKNNKISAEFLIEKTGKYKIQFISNDTKKTITSPSYDIEIIPDRNPKINLQLEEKNIEIPVDQKLELKADVNDDFGIDAVGMKIESKNGTSCIIFDQHKPAEVLTYNLDQKIKASKLGKPGDKVYITIFANDFYPYKYKTDNRPLNLKGHICYSEKICVKILPPANKSKDDKNNKSSQSPSSNGTQKKQNNKTQSPYDLDQNQNGGKQENTLANGKNRTRNSDDTDSNKGTPKQKSGEQNNQQSRKPKTGELAEMLGASKEDIDKLDTFQRNLDNKKAEKNPAPENANKTGKPDDSQKAGSDGKGKSKQNPSKDLANSSDKGRENKKQGNKDNQTQKKNNNPASDPNREKGQEHGGSKKDKLTEGASKTNADKKGTNEKTKAGRGEQKNPNKGDKQNQNGKNSKPNKTAPAEKQDRKTSQKRNEKKPTNKPQPSAKGEKNNQPNTVKRGNKGKQSQDKQGQKNPSENPRQNGGEKPSPKGNKKAKNQKGEKNKPAENGPGNCKKNGNSKTQKDAQGKQAGKGNQNADNNQTNQNQNGNSAEKKGDNSGKQNGKSNAGDREKKQKGNAKPDDNSNRKGSGNSKDNKSQGNSRRRKGDSQGGDIETEKADETELKAKKYLDDLNSLGRALKHAKQKIEAGQVDKKLLTEMNMSEAEFRTFVKEFTERVELAKRKVIAQQRKLKGKVKMVGDKNVISSKCAKNGEGKAVTNKDETVKETDRKAAQDRSKKVSPEYEDLLRAFLKGTAKGK